MKRIPLSPRLDWREKVSAAGLTFHSPKAMFPQTYWDESAAYQFTAREVDTLEAAANRAAGDVPRRRAASHRQAALR